MPTLTDLTALTALREKYIAAIPALNLDGDELEEVQHMPRISGTVQVAGCLSEAENFLTSE